MRAPAHGGAPPAKTKRPSPLLREPPSQFLKIIALKNMAKSTGVQFRL
jgi:hypothetical protein